MDEKIDLKVTIRNYIEGISNIHAEIRKLITNSIETSRNKIEEIHTSFNDLNTKERCDSLRAVMKEDNKQIESIPLLLEWDDVRKSLQKKNERLINLSKRYVTGKISTK